MRLFKRKTNPDVVLRQFRYAYVQARRAGWTHEEVCQAVVEAELDYRWVTQVERMPGNA